MTDTNKFHFNWEVVAVCHSVRLPRAPTLSNICKLVARMAFQCNKVARAVRECGDQEIADERAPGGCPHPGKRTTKSEELSCSPCHAPPAVLVADPMDVKVGVGTRSLVVSGDRPQQTCHRGSGRSPPQSTERGMDTSHTHTLQNSSSQTSYTRRRTPCMTSTVDTQGIFFVGG